MGCLDADRISRTRDLGHACILAIARRQLHPHSASDVLEEHVNAWSCADLDSTQIRLVTPTSSPSMIQGCHQTVI
jgi:hypothetical protein